MAINSSQYKLLIAAPMLQDYLVDKTLGTPLAAGVITLYQDADHQTLKNWYYQTGTAGNYTYSPLPNPLTLSSVGTINDGNGNDVIPFFYPYDETSSANTPQPYYITVDSSLGVRQFTRSNFPFNPIDEQTTATNKNYIVNNVFWRNVGTNYDLTNLTQNPLNGLYSAVLAPSQHEGFSMPDIIYVKDANNVDTDKVSFTQFIAGSSSSLTQDITPEYFCNFQCSSAAGSTNKYIQIPISFHIASLSNTPKCSAVINARIPAGGSGSVSLKILQYNGSGTSSSVIKTLNNVTLTTTWTKYIVNFTMPNATGVTVGTGGDDALYLQIGLPSGVCNLDFAKPALYLSEDVPTNDFDTYDQVASITNSPRTGDWRTSLNSFAPFGWVLANDGSIGSVGSSATARANIDTWPLYNLIWNSVSDTWAPVSGGRGVSAIADWTANKRLQLTLALGRSLIGLPPGMNVSSYSLGIPPWGSATGFFTLTSGSNLLYPGAPIILTGTGLNAAFTSGNIYYVIPSINGSSLTQFQLASSYANAISKVAIAASGTNTGSNILITFCLGGYFGESSHSQSIAEIAAHTHTQKTDLVGSIGTAQIIAVNQGISDNQDLSNINSTGSGNPFNVVQPVTYQNIFIKL